MENKKWLIDANGLWSDIMMLPHNWDMISSEEVDQSIMDSPTVDAVEVVHGRWDPASDDEQDEGEFHCSVCGAPEYFLNCVPMSKFCYNCGARMD